VAGPKLDAGELYVPFVPHIFPLARLAAQSDYMRSCLIVDDTKRVKPRMSWYDPYETSWVPTGWFQAGPASCTSQNEKSPAEL
jgi:hypothetical protein